MNCGARVVLLAALVWGAVVGAAGPAAAVMSGPCDAYFNGVHFDEIDTPAEARELMRVPDDSDLLLTVELNAPVNFAAIEIVLGPRSFELLRYDPNGETSPDTRASTDGDGIGVIQWPLPVNELTQFGQGIYEFQGRTDSCVGNAFFITGDGTPWSSVIGAVATGVGGAGVVLTTLTSWLPGLLRGGGGWGRSGLLGLPSGIGGVVMAQQAGVYPLDTVALVVAVVGGPLVSILIWQGCVMVHGAFAGGGAAAAAGAAPAGTSAGASAGASGAAGTATGLTASGAAGASMPPPPSFTPPSPPPAPAPAPPPAPTPPASAAPPAAAAAAPSSTPTAAAPPAPASPAPAPAAPTPAPQPGVPTAASPAAPAGPTAPTPASPPPVDPTGGASSGGASSGGASSAGAPAPATGAPAPPSPSNPGGVLDPSGGASQANPAASSPTPPPTGAEAAPTASATDLPGSAQGPAGAEAGPQGPTGAEATAPADPTTGATPDVTAAEAQAPTGADPVGGTGAPAASPLDVAGLAAKGVIGLATTAALAAARAVAVRRAGDPQDAGDTPAAYWFHVQGFVALYALNGEEQIVGYLQPGSWYLAKATYEQWVHVHDDERDLEGFAAASVVIPQQA